MPLNSIPAGLAGPDQLDGDPELGRGRTTPRPPPSGPLPTDGTGTLRRSEIASLRNPDGSFKRMQVSDFEGRRLAEGSSPGEHGIHRAAIKQTITDFGASHLRSSLKRTRGQRAQFGRLRERQAANIGGQSERLRRTLGKSASLQAARAGVSKPTSFAGSIQDATRRAGVRQGIVNRGEKAIANQSLKDRLTFVQSGLRRQGVAQQALSQGANIREGVNIGVTDANNAISASNSALFGGVAGSIAGFASDPQNREMFSNLFRRKPASVSGPLNATPHPDG